MGKSNPKPARRRTYVKEWREQRGWNQTELAEMVGLEQGTISRIESGKIAYTQETLEAIADALQCKVGELTDHNPTKDGILVQLARRVRPEDLEQVRGILEGFIKKRA